MRPLPNLGMEQRKARVRLQLPPGKHASGVGIPEAAGPLRTSARRAHCHAAEVRQHAVADDGRASAGSIDQGHRREKSYQHGRRRSCGHRCGDRMSTNPPNVAPGEAVQDLYVVSEGKKRGATREVRAESPFDKYYTVTRVHPGDAILS